MKLPSKLPTLAALASLAAGCAASQIERLEPLAHFPLRLEARVDPVAAHEEWPEPWAGPAEQAPGTERVVRISCSLVALRESLVAEVLGSEAGNLAVRTSREEAARLLAWLDEEARARIVGDVVLAVLDGQQGSLSLSSETAFVAGYDLQQEAQVAIADPRVEVVRTGCQVLATPTLHEGSALELELSLSRRDVERPIAERELRIARHASPVTIQLPVRLAWQLSTRVELESGESLILGSLPIEERREVIVLFADVDVVEAGDLEPE